ncbi:MAG: AAA family ATPase [Acidobacteriota bacterium]
MKIASIRIKNFRAFSDIEVTFNNYTCLVGPNGVGKSTILSALNVFFREIEAIGGGASQLSAQDFYQMNTSEPIEITIVFTGLSEAAQADFSAYCRHDKLVISALATLNDKTSKGEIRQFGQRFVITDFAPYFRALDDKMSVSNLKQIYASIRADYSNLPNVLTKREMELALRSYEQQNEDQCSLVRSDDQFYGFSRGTNLLEKYVQWVFVPAVKDAVSEESEGKSNALAKLLGRSVRSNVNFTDGISRLRADVQVHYRGLLDQGQSALDDISLSLAARLAEWSHPDAGLKLRWSQDFDKCIRIEEPFARIVASEGGFEGDLGRFGHGLQRSYILALLQELMTIGDVGAPRLILGCEEPELYQHPPQARHLSAVMQKLSANGSQVIVSTHHPVFVSGEDFEDVRVVRRDRASRSSTVIQSTYADISRLLADATGEVPRKPAGILATVHQALQTSLSEMFFTPKLVLVEGLEDVAYITTYLNLMEKWDDFRRFGCHTVPVGGKSQMVQAIAIAKSFTIPFYAVFDSDSDKEDQGGSRNKHEKDNRALLTLLGQPKEDSMPTATLWGDNFVAWNSDIFAIVRADVTNGAWIRAQERADQDCGHGGGLRKNTLHIGSRLTYLWQEGQRSSSLEKLCGKLLEFGGRA